MNRTRGLGRRSTRLNTAETPAAMKKLDTKQLLIETAERLFGQHGLDGISLREITLAAGQANSNVVQYHFNDKAGLIGAILEYRVEDFEAWREERMRKLPANKSQRLRELLKILWLPAMTVVDGDGNHTYCRFLLHYLTHPHNVRHPIMQFYDGGKVSGAHKKNLPNLIKTTQMLREHYANLPQIILSRRMSALSMMFLATVVEHDNTYLFIKNKKTTAFDAEAILDMAIAALNAPA